MSAKKPAPRRPPARKTSAPRPRPRKTGSGRRPRPKGLGPRLATWFALTLARLAASHRDDVRARRDAAILRTTHAGCATCHGTGTIATHDKKTGEFTGSKPCPARPATDTVNRWQAAKAARFGPDKRSGLHGWRCPCGARTRRPKFRDPKTATEALRSHERKRHGGTSLGGQWYVQLPEDARPDAAQQPAPVSKTVADSGMTDQQWEKQNKPLAPAVARKRGLCWQCSGQGRLYTAFASQHTVVVCPECQGNGKARQP